jgi:hypothetical protein
MGVRVYSEPIGDVLRNWNEKFATKTHYSPFYFFVGLPLLQPVYFFVKLW